MKKIVGVRFRKPGKIYFFDPENFEIEKGQKVTGIVKNIKPYGAFIELKDGPVGLAYIEDLSVVRIKSPEERFFVGQKIKVMIKSIDKENNRIVLSYKELLGNWEDNIQGFQEKMIVDRYCKRSRSIQKWSFYRA